MILSEMGEDTAEKIKQLIDKADFNKIKLNTDLMCYESELGEMRYALRDISGAVSELMNYISDTKRINREKIKNYLEEIERIVQMY